VGRSLVILGLDYTNAAAEGWGGDRAVLLLPRALVWKPRLSCKRRAKLLAAAVSRLKPVESCLGTLLSKIASSSFRGPKPLGGSQGLSEKEPAQ
jgi:hypothetical protein